ncbi:MAG TPA: NBR1-Ig-like domain-containing protein [Anaerolineales bacterium]|nr:NBR1-Ig-like domain-containing protein [Anaerolineales bacterium]
MHTNFRKILIPFLALAAATLACNQVTGATPQPAATLNALYTSAAQTLEGMSTQAAATQLSPTPTLSLSGPTATPIVVNTFTSVPPLSPVPQTRCDAAAFVSDVTYPDGTNVSLGGAFTKIWRLKNVGTCTWNASYALVFVSGERFGAPTAVSLPTNVGPGQTVDLAVNMVAPNQTGRYRGFWKLRNASNGLFGIGATADSNFYVDVNVTGYTVTGYDFLARYCDASWQNESQDLSCPGTDGDDKGFVQSLNSPKLEDGKTQGNGLLTHPELENNGMISGKYPAFQIQSGDRFQTQIGCLNQANDCDMIFRLQYQIGNGSVRTLGQWREVYEGQFYPLNIDLSTLHGENVKFILSVLSNGSSHEDYALWINPRITRQSSQPATNTPPPTTVVPPTVTFTFTPTVTFTPSATFTATQPPTATETATP